LGRKAEILRFAQDDNQWRRDESLPPTPSQKEFLPFWSGVGKGVSFPLCVTPRSASDERSPPFNRGGEKTLLETPPEEK
jgi:hypothetical protein